MSKIVAFFGSPRTDGYTAQLVHAALSGARQAGAKTVCYDLNDPAVRGCQGCFYCRKHAGCALSDALAPMYGDIADADGIIVGIPIYFWGAGGQVKVWIDRLYPMIDSDFKPRFPGRKIITVFAQGNSDQNKFSEAIGTCHFIFEKFGWTVYDSLLLYGTGARGYEIPQALKDRAFAAGNNLIRSLGADRT
jgi:multimeric flavodoxin WrbA